MIEVATWQVITFFIGLLISMIGTVIGIAKMVLAQYEKRQDERFNVLMECVKTENEAVARVERDLLIFKEAVANAYVRREDYVRGQSVLESKMDALYSKIEMLQIKGAKHD